MTSTWSNVLFNVLFLLLSASHLTNSLLRPPPPPPEASSSLASGTAAGGTTSSSENSPLPPLLTPPLSQSKLLLHPHQAHQLHHQGKEKEKIAPFLLSPSHSNAPSMSLSKETQEHPSQWTDSHPPLLLQSPAGVQSNSELPKISPGGEAVEWNQIKSPTAADRLIDSIVNTSTTPSPALLDVGAASSSLNNTTASLHWANSSLQLEEEKPQSTMDAVLLNTMANKSVEQKWLEAASVINSVTQSLLRASMPFFTEFFVTSNTSTAENDHNISPTCLSSLIHVINAIQEHKKWAYSFIDSSARLPSGLLTGTLTDLGDFDQCRSIRVDSGDEDATSLDSSDDSPDVEVSSVEGEEENGHLFRGSYCIAQFRPVLPRPAPPDINMDDRVINFNSSEQFKSLLGTVFDDAANLAQGFYSLPIHIALCVPSTCSPDDITFILAKLASPLHMSVSLMGSTCDSFDDPFTLSFHQKMSLIALILLLLIVTICTLIDILHKYYSLTLTKCASIIWTTFSSNLICNGEKNLFSKSTIKSKLDESVVGKNFQVNTFYTDQKEHSLSVNECTHGCTSCNITFSTTSANCSTNSVAKTSGTFNELANHVTDVYRNTSNCQVPAEIAQSTQCAISSNDQGEKSLDLIIIESFSVIRNAAKLFTTKYSTSDTRIHFIHGTRVLTMAWIVICHTYTFGTQFLASVGSVRIEEDIRPKRREFLMQFILNGWFSVETFFFLSGYILVYIVYPVLCKTKGKLNFISYVFLRWLRFTPSLIGILIITFLWPLLGSGPVFKNQTSELLKACYNSWWKNLLYINNFASHHSEICMKHTWYIAADFQLHVMAFVSLWLFYWYKKYAFVFNGLMVLAGMIIPAAVVYAFKLPPTLVASTPYIEKFEGLFSYFYFPTYNHITPYFLGLITGYFVVGNFQISIKKSLARIFWILLPMASICIVLSTVAWNRYDLPIEPITSSIYAATHRFIWSLFIAWVAISCSFHERGMVRNFLSSSFWLPLSRISFQIYLVHFPVIYYHFLTQRKPVPFTHYDRLFMSFGAITLSIIGAFITYLLFEAPFGSLVKQLIITKKVQKQEQLKTSTPLTVITVLQVPTNSPVNQATGS